MKHGWQISFIILILLNSIITTCLAVNAINPFQGSWKNEFGDVDIKNCRENQCAIKIFTAHGAYFCELEGKLTVLSNQKAVFNQKEEDHPKKFFPINLTLSKHVITVKVSEDNSYKAHRYCGLNGYFLGKYTNSNFPRIYKTGFNCGKAKTKIEVAICQSRELANADLDLSKLYLQLKAKHLDNLVNQQKAWIKERELCSSSPNLNQCLFNKYSERILSLEQDIINNDSKLRKTTDSVPYNYDYLKKQDVIEVFKNPPLRHYLKAILPPKIFDEILLHYFHNISLEDQDDLSIIIQGGVPGLYSYCEAALALTPTHQTWFAYINTDKKTQLIILGPSNTTSASIPKKLQQWIDRLLPVMDRKEIIYNPIFP